MHAIEQYTGGQINAFFSVAGIARLIPVDFSDITNPFVDGGFDFEKIKKNCGKFFVLDSDDDPYIETTPENTLKYLSASK